jgi:hypothetical protein
VRHPRLLRSIAIRRSDLPLARANITTSGIEELVGSSSPLVFAVLLNAGREREREREREIEPERLPPRITIRTAINSLPVPDHFLLTLFDDFLVTIRVLRGRSTRCFTVPALQRASFLPRKQNQNRTDMFWKVEAVNRSSNCNPESQKLWFEKSRLTKNDRRPSTSRNPVCYRRGARRSAPP